MLRGEDTRETTVSKGREKGGKYRDQRRDSQNTIGKSVRTVKPICN